MTYEEREEILQEIRGYLYLNGWSRSQIKEKMIGVSTYTDWHLRRFLRLSRETYEREGKQ